MVRVFYEPPPYGPKTCLNRTGYGVQGGGLLGEVLERASKSRQPGMIMAGTVVVIAALCYLPLVGSKLPFSMEPEYQAAQRKNIPWVPTTNDFTEISDVIFGTLAISTGAYMRYHNMNPVFRGRD